jgi:hypothetical protein
MALLLLAVSSKRTLNHSLLGSSLSLSSRSSRNLIIQEEGWNQQNKSSRSICSTASFSRLKVKGGEFYYYGFKMNNRIALQVERLQGFSKFKGERLKKNSCRRRTIMICGVFGAVVTSMDIEMAREWHGNMTWSENDVEWRNSILLRMLFSYNQVL